MHNLVSMHNQVQFGAISATVGLIIVAALMALAVFVFVKLVDRLGVLKTLAWCLGVFFLGIVGLSLMKFMGRAKAVTKHKQAATEAISFARAEAAGSLPDHPRLVASNSFSAISVRDEQPTTSAWDENIAPVANIYPGISECGRPLAAKLVVHLQNELKTKEQSPKAEADAPVKYRIALKNTGLDNPDFLNFLINFRKEFTTAFPDSFVDDITDEKSAEPKGKEKEYSRLNVTVSKLNDPTMRATSWDDGKTSNQSGQIVCQLRRDGRMGQMEFASDFIEKSWVADAEKFVSRWPKRKFIIGFSPRLAKSEQEARVAALKDANVRLAKSANKIFQPNYDMERNVVDRFIQKLTMPYGSVWREAVLIDHGLPQTKLQSYGGQESAAASFKQPHRSNAGHSDNVPSYGPPIHNPPVSNPPVGVRVGRAAKYVGPSNLNNPTNPEAMVAGLMMMTIVVGWVSNWLTQGYYRKPVWTVAGTLFSLGFFFLILIVLLSFA